MLDPDVLGTNNHPNDVESKAVTRTLKARHPYFGGTAELALFSPGHLRDRTAEVVRGAGLHLYKSHGPLRFTGCLTRRHQVNVSVAILESPFRNLPPVNGEPFLSNSFAPQPHALPRLRHNREIIEGPWRPGTVRARYASLFCLRFSSLSHNHEWYPASSTPLPSPACRPSR
jgi:hypothetical protein